MMSQGDQMAFLLTADDLSVMSRIVVEGYMAGLALEGMPCPYPLHWWDGVAWQNGYNHGVEARNEFDQLSNGERS